MNTEELIIYKNMLVEDIDREIVPKIEDIKNRESIDPIYIYIFYECRECASKMYLCRKWKKHRRLFSIIP